MARRRFAWIVALMVFVFLMWVPVQSSGAIPSADGFRAQAQVVGDATGTAVAAANATGTALATNNTSGATATAIAANATATAAAANATATALAIASRTPTSTPSPTTTPEPPVVVTSGSGQLLIIGCVGPNGFIRLTDAPCRANERAVELVGQVESDRCTPTPVPRR